MTEKEALIIDVISQYMSSVPDYKKEIIGLLQEILSKKPIGELKILLD